jgi:CubicO group peptidase (beta-lactamase class C family)
MTIRILLLFFSFSLVQQSQAQAVKSKRPLETTSYFPDYGSWQVKEPASMGINAALLKAAVDFAIAAEVKNPRSMEENHYRTFGKEPFGEGIGPFADRGDPTGLIIYKGYVVAQWGDPNRCDMTHSVTKSFLSTVVGLALDKGLIRNVKDTLAQYVPPIEAFTHGEVRRPAEDFGKPMLLYPFATGHNKTITWDDMLRQTSDWEGTLWGKPDWADRPDADASKWLNRPRNQPGTTYEYNDVRVNAMALAATMVWRKPLPQVLKENIMDKIGAGNTWRWTGYRNAWIVLDGQPVQSVSGGGHWGAGIFINTWDMARFGLFTLHKGKWKGQQLLSENFFQMATKPTAPKPDYGFMNFFLNTDKKYLPDAPATAYCHIGNGTNMIYVDTENEVVAVVRWFDSKQQNEIVKRILAALPTRP